MAIDLLLPEVSENVKRKFIVPKPISDEFDLYVAAAREQAPGVDENMILQAILEKHLRKDRSFRAWLKVNSRNDNGGKKPQTPSES